MAKSSTITIELSEGTTTNEADAIMKKMLNALNQEQIKKVKDAHLSMLIMSVEQKNLNQDFSDIAGEDVEFGDDNLD